MNCDIEGVQYGQSTSQAVPGYVDVLVWVESDVLQDNFPVTLIFVVEPSMDVKLPVFFGVGNSIGDEI